MSHDDMSSGEAFIDRHCDPALVDDPASPSITPALAFGATFTLTGTEALLIVTGKGWWVLPVSVLVAAFCAMFLGLMWAQCREIMQIFAKASPPPRKMLCENCPHPRRRKGRPVVPGAALYPLTTRTVPHPPPPQPPPRVGVDGAVYHPDPKIETRHIRPGDIETRKIRPGDILWPSGDRVPPDLDD